MAVGHPYIAVALAFLSLSSPNVLTYIFIALTLGTLTLLFRFPLGRRSCRLFDRDQLGFGTDGRRHSRRHQHSG